MRWEVSAMINKQTLMQKYQQFRQNPMAMLSQRYKIPQNINFNNADDIIQYLMNTGQVSQSQYNQMRQAARMFQ